MKKIIESIEIVPKKIISLITLAALALVISLTSSCKKEVNCWECSFQPLNGQTRANEKVCDSQTEPVFYDSIGNQWDSNCWRK